MEPPTAFHDTMREVSRRAYYDDGNHAERRTWATACR